MPLAALIGFVAGARRRRRQNRSVALCAGIISGVVLTACASTATVAVDPIGSSQSSATPARPASQPVPHGIPGHWLISFDDEFSGHVLNRSRWNTGWFGTGITRPVDPQQEADCYDPRQVSVSGGSLSIIAVPRPERCAGAVRPFASGLVNTDKKFSFRYGAFEARAWLPGDTAQISDWPAIWADGQHWPFDGEIDFVEGLRGRPCSHFYSLQGDPGRCSRAAGAAAAWHTYGARWRPGSITFYYDGRAFWRETRGVTNQPMYLILDLAVPRQWAASPRGQSMRVDYVRVWRGG